MLVLGGCGRNGADGPFTDSRIPPGLARQFYPPPGWAWGLIQVGGEPPIRYGVAAPAVRSRGDVLIACGHGESVEAWFETASALTSAGYTVWIMDGAGQGGSGRFTPPRDLGHISDFSAQVRGLQAMTAVIARPSVLMAQSTAAPSALDAASRGTAIRAVILSDPVFAAGSAPINGVAALSAAPAFAKAKLGWVRATGQPAWKRPASPAKDRHGVIDAWQGANPDLRMGGVSFGWLAAFEDQVRALTPARLGRIAAPVLMLRPEPRAGLGRGEAICRAMPACRLHALHGAGGSLHLESDAVYSAWLAEVEAALAAAFIPS